MVETQLNTKKGTFITQYSIVYSKPTIKIPNNLTVLKIH
jgi:hypothetical protein